MKIKKIIYLGISCLLLSTISGCSKNSLAIVYENDEVGYSLFDLGEDNNETSVIFFDDDNVISENGEESTRPERRVSNTLGSSDCYMVKSGTTELLVDGGYQSITSYGSVKKIDEDNYQFNDEYIKKECDENLLKKIASVISSDGVLDYLIVTHADFDHIAALIVDGGIFDAFLNHKTITGFNGNSVTFSKINYIIDFDSGLVKNFSDEETDKSQRLIRSDYYQAYVSKRNKLVNNGSNYCPASAFFNNDNLETQGVSISDDNKALAMPDKVVNKLDKIKNSNVQYILDENYDNKVDAIKDNSYASNVMFSKENGSIQSVDVNDSGKRYYYSLKFNTGELRILYNWHYDYIYHSSFNKDDSDSQSSDPNENVYDSQDANNISVCFEVINEKFKFLSLGDLGGNGENGLLKYYKDTNMLSDISLMKASHHGSSYNGENSKDLFSLAKTRIVVITGCANYKDANWQNSSDDKVVSSLVGRTKLNQTLFTNISSAYNSKEDQPLIMCTNINSHRFENDVDHFESLPFYGDIKVKYNGGKLHVSNSYKGPIKPYISQEWNTEYQKNNKKEFTFYTRKDKKIISLQNTDWFDAVGFKYGE